MLINLDEDNETPEVVDSNEKMTTMSEPDEPEESVVAEQTEEAGKWDRHLVRRVLVAKDEGHISDQAYHELRMALNDRTALPPIHVLKAERKEQNQAIGITSLPKVNKNQPTYIIQADNKHL